MGETIPLTVLQALDRLNGHARAYGCGKQAIYAYKAFAALMLAHAGALQVRAVGLMAKCHNCAGTGLFITYDGYETGESCRTCARTGWVHLRFTETTHAGIVWHHPWRSGGHRLFVIGAKIKTCEYRPADRRLVVTDLDGSTRDIPFESPGDWQPNRGGDKLEPAHAVAMFNTVEDWISGLRRLDVDPDIGWPLETAQREMHGYALELGRRIGATCHYCDATEIASGQAHMHDLLLWSIPTCAAHQRMPVGEWDKTVPPSALTPEVLKWLARRGWSPGMELKRNREAA